MFAGNVYRHQLVLQYLAKEEIHDIRKKIRRLLATFVELDFWYLAEREARYGQRRIDSLFLMFMELDKNLNVEKYLARDKIIFTRKSNIYS